MPFAGIADADQLAILTTAVDEHCRQAGIDLASAERDEVARVVVALFNNGAATAEELRAALQARAQREAERYG